MFRILQDGDNELRRFDFSLFKITIFHQIQTSRPLNGVVSTRLIHTIQSGLKKRVELIKYKNHHTISTVTVALSAAIRLPRRKHVAEFAHIFKNWMAKLSNEELSFLPFDKQ